MAYAISATYTVKPGEEAAVETALLTMRDLTCREPACILYEAHRSVEDPQVFFLYELYQDESGFRAHIATEHFTRHIKGEVWPRLQERRRVIGEPLAAAPVRA